MDFALTGFDVGQLPPWRWFMKTTDAEDPYGPLNTGVVWECSAFGVDFASYLPLVPIAGITDANLGFSGTPAPSGGVTVNWFCEFFLTGADPATRGFFGELYPTAIDEREFDMINQTLPGKFIPEPLVITPRKWNLD